MIGAHRVSSWLITLVLMEHASITGLAAPRTHHCAVEIMTSDGTRLAGHVYGSRAARHTVVFLHGLCLNDAVWSRQVDQLRRRYGGDLRIVTYDHRGHGRSGEAPADTYTVEQLADDFADVLKALDVEGSVTFVGHSMGGMVVLAYLARSAVDRPVEPEGLVLVATAAGHLTEQGYGRILATPGFGALLSIAGWMPGRAVATTLGVVCLAVGRLWPNQRGVLEKVAEAAASTPVPTGAGFLSALREYDVKSTLGRIRARTTTIVSGGTDQLTPVVRSRELADAISGARHVHLPGAGHQLPEEAPEIINQAIEDTISRCRASQLVA